MTKAGTKLGRRHETSGRKALDVDPGIKVANLTRLRRVEGRSAASRR